MTTSLNLVGKYLPMFLELMMDIPDTNTPGARLIKAFARIISNAVGPKSAQNIVDDHKTEIVFQHGKDPSPNTINKTWWENKSPDMPQFLVRSLLPIGPASKMAPPYCNRINQGILCQRHAENNNLSPIEFLLKYVNLIFCRSSHLGEAMNAHEVMEGLVEIFTSPGPVGNPDIDNLSFVFVKGKSELTPVRANRIDLVHALRILYYTGYMIWFANPDGFTNYHPLVLITNVFLAQTNFFPSNSDIDQPLSRAEKNNYLLALGLNIYEAMRKDFDAKFFLAAADLFPSTVNPTMMPVPLGLKDDTQPPPRPLSDHEDFFTPFYFLFGKNVPSGTTEDGATAEILDHSMLPFYEAAVEQDLDSTGVKAIKTLLTMVCPKHTLNLRVKRNYGLKDKAAMVKLLNEHLQTFGNTHSAYLNELNEAIHP
jgi:hypothetical protein